MRLKPLHLLMIEQPDGDKPIGQQQSQYRGTKGADIQGTQIDGHHNPKEGDVKQHHGRMDAGDADAQKSIKGQTHGTAVLISAEQQIDSGYHEEGRYASREGTEQKPGCGAESQIGTGYHSAVDADESITVVEFQHQIGG